MLRVILTVAREGLVLLRRGKIFVPAAVILAIVIGFANLASDWSIADFNKILFDIGAFGFHMTGCFVAILWGTKVVTDSTEQGSLEIQLASPVSRTTWLVGRYLGLVAALAVLGFVFLVVWQLVMLMNSFGWMTMRQWSVFAILSVEWLIVAAIAILFASFCRPPVALFSSLCLWIAGLVSASIVATLAPDTPIFQKKFVEGFAWLWDLAQFNLVDLLHSDVFPNHVVLWTLGGYAFVRILLLLTLASLIFRRRDLVY